MPQVKSYRGSLDLSANLNGKLKTINDPLENSVTLDNDESILAQSKSNNKLKLNKVANQNYLGALRQRNPLFDASDIVMPPLGFGGS